MPVFIPYLLTPVSTPTSLSVHISLRLTEKPWLIWQSWADTIINDTKNAIYNYINAFLPSFSLNFRKTGLCN